jgi:hypothetical protein
MSRKVLPLLLLAACGNPDNLIAGSAGATSTTPFIAFENINSSISGELTPRDAAGNPSGPKLGVVILSDVPDLCNVLKANPRYFRDPPEPYTAMIHFVPRDWLGTFILGRGGPDAEASSEIIAASTPHQAVTPLTAFADGFGYIAITNWETNAGGSSSGSFSLNYNDPQDTVLEHPFYGRFKTGVCATLEGTLLP